MRDFKISFYFAFTALLLLTGYIPAYAQTGPESLATPGTYTLALVRPPTTEPGVFILRVAADKVLQSCLKISDMSYEARMEGNSLNITVGDYKIDKKSRPHGQLHGCRPHAQMPAAEIPLNRDTLIENNIETITFQHGKATDYYDLDISDDYVQLLPSENAVSFAMKYRPQKISNVRNPLLHWFYPSRTVLLYTPATSDSSLSREAVQTYAQKTGLTPLETVLDDFKSPLVRDGFYYYVDTGSVLPDSAFKPDGEKLDRIAVGGSEVLIFVKTPGIYN